jgi:prophage antirepressor-like protein
MEHGPGNALARLTATFEGSTVTAIEYSGQPMMMAQEVGKVLGFSDATRFTSALAEYALIEGKHFVKLVGPELAAFKAAMPDTVNAQARHLVLLTEAGLYRALMRSRAPRAEDFQEWLASELLPQLRKTGTYTFAVPPEQIEAETRAMRDYISMA